MLEIKVVVNDELMRITDEGEFRNTIKDAMMSLYEHFVEEWKKEKEGSKGHFERRGEDVAR